MTGESSGRGRSVQSVEISVGILKVLAAMGGPATLSDIAAQLKMPPAKLHRYLASFVDSGMVTHRRSGSYDLGPVAAEIGMAAIARVDVVNRAADILPVLVEETGCTAMLSVWGTRGPTVVRWERARVPLVTVLGVGSVLPVLTSATGRAFVAYLPDRVIEDLARSETGKDVKKEIAAVRQQVHSDGMAIAIEDYIPGLFALARPVLDLQNQAAAVITLISTDRKELGVDGTVWRIFHTMETIGA